MAGLEIYLHMLCSTFERHCKFLSRAPRVVSAWYTKYARTHNGRMSYCITFVVIIIIDPQPPWNGACTLLLVSAMAYMRRSQNWSCMVTGHAVMIRVGCPFPPQGLCRHGRRESSCQAQGGARSTWTVQSTRTIEDLWDTKPCRMFTPNMQQLAWSLLQHSWISSPPRCRGDHSPNDPAVFQLPDVHQ